MKADYKAHSKPQKADHKGLVENNVANTEPVQKAPAPHPAHRQMFLSTMDAIQRSEDVLSTREANFGSEQPIQCDTDIRHTSTEITWNDKKGIVGKRMVAKLDPTEPVVGSKTDNGLMTDLDREVARLNPGMWARGHLLNHDLGGYGVPENLFPISAGANAQHAQAVEYPVKRALSTAKTNQDQDSDEPNTHVYYEVTVKGTPTRSQFHCDWYFTGDDYKKDANDHSDNKTVVESNLNHNTSGTTEDPYFSARGRPNGLATWAHGTRSGTEDLDFEENVNMQNSDQAIPAIGLGDVATPRKLTEEQEEEIRNAGSKNKVERWYQQEQARVPSIARDMAIDQLVAEMKRNGDLKTTERVAKLKIKKNNTHGREVSERARRIKIDLLSDLKRQYLRKIRDLERMNDSEN